MLCVFGKGRLGMDPEQKMTNNSGKYYKVRIAVNRMTKKNGELEKETLWCSGLVHEGKIAYQLDRLKKGSVVSFVANKGWVQQWQDKQGQPRADLDLGFLALIEGMPQEGETQNGNGGHTPAPAPVQGPVQAPAPAPATQVWDGKNWVAAPPQQSIAQPQTPPPQNTGLPF